MYHAVIVSRIIPVDSGGSRKTNAFVCLTNRHCQSTGAHHIGCMAIVLIFLLGVGNFAMHRAVLESGHPLLGQMPWFVHLLGGKVTFVTEFLLLLAAMLLAANGWPWLALVYVGYSALNAIGAWLVLSGRV